MSENVNQMTRVEQIGRHLSNSRQYRRLRLSEAATLLNISTSRYKSYEIGTQTPSLPELEVLAIFFNTTLSSLLSREELPVDMPAMDSTNIWKFLKLRKKIIATHIKKALEDVEIPRPDIAKALGVTPKELSGYLSGKKPIPVPALEILCRIADIAIQSLFGTRGLVGEKLSQTERIAGYKRLPADLQDFIAQPINRPYVDLAYRLSSLPVDKLRSIAEGLLDITF